MKRSKFYSVVALASIATKDFEAAGLLAPYDQAWLDENFLDPRGAEINGKSYITPTSAQIIPLVYYNKTIFKDNGIEVPKNYAEFEAAVDKLAAAKVTPIELAGA